MSQTIKATSLDDLSDVLVTLTIKRPDGKLLDVTLRAISEGEVTDIRHSVDWPKPPIKDYKSATEPVYDYANKDYQKALESANTELACRVLLAMLQLHIPGETEAEKLATLKKRLGHYAFAQLTEAVERINFIKETDIENVVRSFRPARNGDTPGHGETLMESGAVVEVAEA